MEENIVSGLFQSEWTDEFLEFIIALLAKITIIEVSFECLPFKVVLQQNQPRKGCNIQLLNNTISEIGYECEIEPQEILNCKFPHRERYFLVPRSEYNFGRVPRFSPGIVLLNTGQLLVEIGHHLVEEVLELSDRIDVTGVGEMPALGRVLHFLTSEFDELVDGKVSEYHAVILASPHLVTRVGITLCIQHPLPFSFSQSVITNLATSLFLNSVSSQTSRKSSNCLDLEKCRL